MDPDEAQRRTQERPEGLLEGLMYTLGYDRDRLHPASLAELRRLDEIHDQFMRLADARDSAGLWAWLGAGGGVPARLRRPIHATGVPHWPDDDAEPTLENIRARLSIILRHQLLAFLAVLDHEVGPALATSDWSGYSLVGMLIAPPTSPSSRQQILSPTALLIDLVMASAMANSERRWPDARPSASSMAESMTRRGLGRPNFINHVHRLRNGHTKLSGREFKSFVREVRHGLTGPGQTVEVEARMMFPLLVAAHLLSMMMPRVDGSTHHDRRGWREAYLESWRHHSMARGVALDPANAAGPSGWVTFNQSS